MSKFDEPLKIEVIGAAIIIDPIFPETKAERTARKSSNIIGVRDVQPKNKFYPEDQSKHGIDEWDEHPCQGIVKGISSILVDDPVMGSIKINDRLAFRISSGEPIVFKDHVYWRIAPHEVMFKYQGADR